MTKNNEVTAFKACGISVRRLGLPVLLMSAALSAAAFCFRLLLDSRGQSDTGRHPQRDQRPPGADLSAPRTQMDLPRLPDLLFQILRSVGKADGRAVCFRARSEELPCSARNQRQPRTLAAEHQHLGLGTGRGPRPLRRGRMQRSELHRHDVSGAHRNARRLPERREAGQADELSGARAATSSEPAAERLRHGASCMCSITRNLPCPCSR